MSNNALQYYLCDVNHDNMVLMIKSKYGYEGYGLLMELLLKICRREGYFCRWEEDDIMVFAAETGKDFELIKGIAAFALEKGFFDMGMYEKYHILTSADLQQKFLKAVKRRNKLEIHEEYFLVELPDKFKNDNEVKDVYNSEENVYNSEENVCNFSTSKVKSSKVKLSKVKLSQHNQSKVSAPDCDALPFGIDDGTPNIPDDVDDVDDVDDGVDDVDDDYKKTISLLKEYGMKVNSGTKAAVKQWLSEFGADIIAYAVEEADSRDKLSRGYISSILKTLKERRLDTIGKIRAYEDKYRKNNTKKYFSDKDSSVYKSGGTDYSDFERRMNLKY